jgi:hypothetical protein
MIYSVFVKNKWFSKENDSRGVIWVIDENRGDLWLFLNQKCEIVRIMRWYLHEDMNERLIIDWISR